MKAVAVFDMGGVKGETIFEDSVGGLKLSATFTELPEGKHGFHIHTNGDLRGEGCMGACSHFHKGPKSDHGGPPTATNKGQRHTGDLGNVDTVNHTYHYKLAGVKVVGDFVDNYKQDLPSEFGVLNLFDPTKMLLTQIVMV
jgi:Cu/Zn superoxide dismutase